VITPEEDESNVAGLAARLPALIGSQRRSFPPEDLPSRNIATKYMKRGQKCQHIYVRLRMFLSEF
jgi:hypothetical protein